MATTQPQVNAAPIADVRTDGGLSQHVVQEIEAARERCLTADGGCEVMRCILLCVMHRVAAPAWLADAFARRVLQVTNAHQASWDSAFGRPWPKGTRLHFVRRHRHLVRLVHAAVWDLASAGRPINRVLFDEIGERQGIDASGSTVERLYYEALSQGMPNIAELRGVAPARR